MIPIILPPSVEFPYERCCFCRTPTPWWTDLKHRIPGGQVACCPDCAKTHKRVPSKAKWCAKERALTPSFTR